MLGNVSKFPFSQDPGANQTFSWTSTVFAGVTVLLSLLSAAVISATILATTKTQLSDLVFVVSSDHTVTQQYITASSAAMANLMAQTSALTAQINSLNDRLSQERADRIESEHRLENRQR